MSKQDHFWKKLKKPIMALAPMADVTDTAFRRLFAKYGKPDVMFTEFVSVAGLCSSGRERVLYDLKYVERERPIVAQIWGSNPDQFFESAKLIRQLKFDGIDINMGCPDKKVEKQLGGAALIRHPDLAIKIIEAAKRGAGPLPVSVKTRLGYTRNTMEEWVSRLLEARPVAITMHARTRKEMSKVPADWQSISRMVKLVRASGQETIVLGNGDVSTLEEARRRVKETGCDGVMIGRGIFGNPWFFSPDAPRDSVPIPNRLSVLIEHIQLYERAHRNKKSFEVMKKHFKAYVSDFDGAKEIRALLMETHSADQAIKVLTQSIESLKKKRVSRYN
ncbi:MAG: tRNA-dihydrouridine synthase family protein, partial [bacterium]|nr:tRNA-dihydrouridine synthase family protein [bacterium]